MRTHRTHIARGAAALAVAASLITLAAPALSQSTAPTQSTPPETAAAQERMRERMQARLDRLAQRLAIQPAQQQAWNEYVAAAQSMVGTKPNRPAKDADAATILRFRANLSTQRAQKLGQLADATAKFEQVLTAEQRKVLDESTRHWGHKWGGRHGGV